MRRARAGLRAAAMETAIVLVLGSSLAAVSLGLLELQYGEVFSLSVADVFTAGAAGLTVGAIFRITLLLHRRWKIKIGRYTAAAALCALAAVLGTIIAFIPSECPGGLFSTGRCGAHEAAAWGQVAGLAAVVNFGFAGLVLGCLRFVRSLPRFVREVAADGAAQILHWSRAIRARGIGPSGGWPIVRRHRRSGGAEPPKRRRRPGGPKGRPTPRRADAERARRERLRAGA